MCLTTIRFPANKCSVCNRYRLRLSSSLNESINSHIVGWNAFNDQIKYVAIIFDGIGKTINDDDDCISYFFTLSPVKRVHIWEYMRVN